MRLVTPRRMAATVLCAALTLGAAVPAIAHSDSASRAPLPQAPTLLKQVQPLDDTGTLVHPVSALLSAVLKADNGRLSTADATKYAADIDAAMEAVKKANATDMPATPKQPADETTADDSQLGANMDAMDDALAAIDKSVDELVAASTEGQTATVAPQVQTTLKSVADFLMMTAKNMQGQPATNLPAPNDMTQTPAL
ncbi:hypothetical protein ACF1G0_28360 [Streptomyces sp. NPDC013953]|uniref:hypothetical protein n=1 Tax=Streptomyces sp. NPDC013953 TaxID=3364868 RepID=UPI0036FF52EF